MLHANPRISEFGSIGLILDDLPEKGRLLSRILISKGYSANSLTYPQNEVGTGLVPVLTSARTATRAVPTITSLDSPEARTISILQKVRENNPSLPIFICSDSVTKQFKNQAAKWGTSIFFPKADVARSLCLEIRRPRVWVKQTLDQIKKIVVEQ